MTLLQSACTAKVRTFIVLLVGAGNNGGDALYAGARLARSNVPCTTSARTVGVRRHPQSVREARHQRQAETGPRAVGAGDHTAAAVTDQHDQVAIRQHRRRIQRSRARADVGVDHDVGGRLAGEQHDVGPATHWHLFALERHPKLAPRKPRVPRLRSLLPARDGRNDGHAWAGGVSRGR